MLALAREHDQLLEAREARDYWHTRARALPRRRLAARREAVEMARRSDAHLEEAARRALLAAPGPALGALLDIRRTRLGRGLRRAAYTGLAALAATAALAGVAADLAWRLLAGIF
jgi:hypothetical protein